MRQLRPTSRSRACAVDRRRGTVRAATVGLAFSTGVVVGEFLVVSRFRNMRISAAIGSSSLSFVAVPPLSRRRRSSPARRDRVFHRGRPDHHGLRQGRGCAGGLGQNSFLDRTDQAVVTEHAQFATVLITIASPAAVTVNPDAARAPVHAENIAGQSIDAQGGKW
jgi:hypothetical protein